MGPSNGPLFRCGSKTDTAPTQEGAPAPAPVDVLVGTRALVQRAASPTPLMTLCMRRDPYRRMSLHPPTHQATGGENVPPPNVPLVHQGLVKHTGHVVRAFADANPQGSPPPVTTLQKTCMSCVTAGTPAGRRLPATTVLGVQPQTVLHWRESRRQSMPSTTLQQKRFN